MPLGVFHDLFEKSFANATSYSMPFAFVSALVFRENHLTHNDWMALCQEYWRTPSVSLPGMPVLTPHVKKTRGKERKGENKVMSSEEPRVG